jgi:hypothetical protein
LIAGSSKSEVESYRAAGVLDYQDAISRPSGTADDAAPAGRALTRLEEDACPYRRARSVTSSMCATST